MKVRASVKPICEKCKVIKRNGKVMVISRILSTNRDRVNQISNGSWAKYRGCPEQRPFQK